MFFNSFEEFINMGGYAFHVWFCYSMVLLSLVTYFIYSKNSIKSKKRELKKFYRRMDASQQSLSIEQNQVEEK